MWGDPITIYEGESLEAFQAEFVRLCAMYPKRELYEICKYIFRDKPEDSRRAMLAAGQWGNDLAILERIRIAKQYGGEANASKTDKELRLAEIAEFASDPKQRGADRVAAWKLIAEMNGEIVKNTDIKSNGEALPAFPSVTFAIDPRAAAA